MTEQWIVIPNWDKFQHYRDRDPVWIKTYTSLLSNPDYEALSLAARGTLHGLWMLYARAHQQLSTHQARNTLATNHGDASHFARTLESLNHAGFIEVSASRPLAGCYQLASDTRARASAVARGGSKEPPKRRARTHALSDERASTPEKNKSAAPCPDCGIGGDRHLADCPAAANNGRVDTQELEELF